MVWLRQSEMRNMTSVIRGLARNVIGLYLTGAVMLSASAADAADAVNGERLARRWCASCHVVASNQGGATSEAPPFATVAARPDFEAAKIAQFLLEPHPKMPNMALTWSEAGDLAAYIASLR
jgi:mono/diheme cytochrome c family protein